MVSYTSIPSDAPRAPKVPVCHGNGRGRRVHVAWRDGSVPATGVGRGAVAF